MLHFALVANGHAARVAAPTCERLPQIRAALDASNELPHTQHLATCVTGLIVGGRRDARFDGTHFANTSSSRGKDWWRGPGLTDPAMHMPLRAWSEELRIRRVHNDFFLRLDMRSDVHPRRGGNSSWAIPAAQYHLGDRQAECNLDSPQWPESILTPVTEALRPVSVRWDLEPCYCKRRDCRCTRTPAPWWEQMTKVRACFDDVVRHERQRARRYDFVLRLRSDFDVVKNGLTASAFIATAHRSLVQGPPRVSTFPFEACYMNVDWGWMAPRKLAGVAFGIERDATCTWMQCLANAFKEARTHEQRFPDRATWIGRSSPCDNLDISDSILIEWWLANGISFDAMATEVPEGRGSYHGLMNNFVCPARSQAIGLTTPANASRSLHRAASCKLTEIQVD